MSGQKPKPKVTLAQKKPIAKVPAVLSIKTVPALSAKAHQRMIQDFLLIWLDANIQESQEQVQKNLQLLRSLIKSVNIFNNADLCMKFFNEVHDEKVFLIVSGPLGQQVIPAIHDKPSLDTIYVFCSDKARHELWAKQWSKIKGVHTQIFTIFASLQQLVKQCNQDATPVSFVSTHHGISSTNLDQLDPSFMYTQIFKEILLELKYDQQSVKDLASYCHELYADNRIELDIINEFARDYRASSAIWWYTRECFTYQMLNRGLRRMESDIIIKMGFFIHDLHQQLKDLFAEQFSGQVANVFTVYRGQSLSLEDFQKLQKTQGGLISFNSFLSTSEKRDVSLGFARIALVKKDSVGILFKLTVHPANASSTPFALIDRVSYFKEEKEVLFSMHTVFRIVAIEAIENNNRLYQVSLELTGDKDPQLQTLTERIREETFPHAPGWYRIGKLLLKLGQFDRAEQVYSTILLQTNNEKDKADIYTQLGQIKNNQGDYEQAKLFYEKALEIDQKTVPENHASLANLLNNIGAVYHNLKDYPRARAFYVKAHEIYKRILPPDHLDLASSYNNIGLVHSEIEEYDQALQFYHRALEIKEKTLPSNHPLLATAYNNIASVYYNKNEYEKSLVFYEKALDIEQKTMPADHCDLATTFNNMAWVFRATKDYTQALSLYERALDIKQKSLPANHDSLQDIRQSIDYVKKKLWVWPLRP